MITSNQIYYDTRFDTECVLTCKPIINEINTTIASSIALITLHQGVEKSYKDYFTMIANNVSIYVETLSTHVENYVDNLTAFMNNESVGSVIDNYVSYFNQLYKEIMILFESYIGFETTEMLNAIRDARNIIPDDDNDNAILQ